MQGWAALSIPRDTPREAWAIRHGTINHWLVPLHAVLHRESLWSVLCLSCHILQLILSVLRVECSLAHFGRGSLAAILHVLRHAILPMG